MLCNCLECQHLLSSGERHPHLKTISRISRSELTKCSLCLTFYLLEDGQWEPLSSGNEFLTQPVAAHNDTLMHN